MAIRYLESGPAVHTVRHELEPTVGTGTATATKPRVHGTHKTLSAKGVYELSMFSSALVKSAIADSFRKLSPRTQVKNSMMFVVYVSSILTTILWVMALRGQAEAPAGFILAVSVWSWFTVLFTNFVEALTGGRSKQQAVSSRGIKTTVQARVLADAGRRDCVEARTAAALHHDGIVLIEVDDMMPGDDEVIGGVASVDESAIIGESALVTRELGEDSSSVTDGTRVFPDWITMRITANLGEGFLDRMISMVEGVKHQKTPNELALTILLVSLTIILMLATATLLPYSAFLMEATRAGSPITTTVLVALLVYLIPTTIGGLLSAISMAGMSRMMQASVVTTLGRAIETAGDVDVSLLDKIDTITHGNHQISRFIPVPDVAAGQLAEAAWLLSLADETSEGHSIAMLARDLGEASIDEAVLTRTQPVYVVFSVQTRTNDINVGHNGEARQIRKGAADTICIHVTLLAGRFPGAVLTAVDDVVRQGDAPLVVSDNDRVFGVAELEDIVKAGARERFAELRRMGIKTVMITGDNHLTVASIAAEAGINGFIVEATPKTKPALIREQQARDRLVAMTDDDTSDTPVLAQADVTIAISSDAQAVEEAGNMVDLNSSPTKLIRIIEIGKQMLMTRGPLTTFSIANDVAKHFAIVLAALATMYPQLATLDVMRLATPASAVMSAVVFNALIAVFLTPLVLKDMKYRAPGAATLPCHNFLIYGLGDLLLPFPGVRIIDMFLAAMGWV